MILISLSKLKELFKQLFNFLLLDAASRVKAEKIRLALEKMREASVQKLFIKAFTLDGSGKSLLVDEGMSVAHVCRLLADKNHVPMDPKWTVVEHLPDLFMGKYLFHIDLSLIDPQNEFQVPLTLGCIILIHRKSIRGPRVASGKPVALDKGFKEQTAFRREAREDSTLFDPGEVPFGAV